jgi:hypothetical protein
MTEQHSWPPAGFDPLMAAPGDIVTLRRPRKVTKTTLTVKDGNGGMLNALAMPDLIAALEELIECYTISLESDVAWRNADDDESIIKARAAIAKARGTQ